MSSRESELRGHVDPKRSDGLTKIKPAHSIQTISGTGANHYGGAFLSRFYEPWLGKSKEEKKIYLSNPTWGECFVLTRPGIRARWDRAD